VLLEGGELGRLHAAGLHTLLQKLGFHLGIADHPAELGSEPSSTGFATPAGANTACHENTLKRGGAGPSAGCPARCAEVCALIRACTSLLLVRR